MLFFKQKTAYELRISDWSSDVCSSDLGTHIVLVDVGHSYIGLCEMVNGYYFTYSEENPIRFNPFYIGEGDSLDTEKKESIKTLLLALWQKKDEELKS